MREREEEREAQINRGGGIAGETEGGRHGRGGEGTGERWQNRQTELEWESEWESLV